MQIKQYPTAFCYSPSRVRAIVLGADPSNFSDKGERKILTKVFGIGDGDARYFEGILKNLKEVGLGLEDIYVDNLIKDYLDTETSKNKEWYAIAKENIPLCLARLDAIDKKRKLPILLTTEALYKALIKTPFMDAKKLYSLEEPIPIPAESNELKRPLIPFYRHQNYNMLIQQWNLYRLRIMEILSSN